MSKKSNGCKAPSRPTTKRLFAVSGNRCAFPDCTVAIVDGQSGSIVGQMCHIKGENPGAARYDLSQREDQRHAFENLILLCNVHHKVVDDDEITYTVDRLTQIKLKHETKQLTPSTIDDENVDKLIANVKSASHSSIVASYGQTGGQTAHTITNNYYAAPPVEESVQLDATLIAVNDIRYLIEFGCAGLQLTVACRGTRVAKIQSAFLSIDCVDVMPGLQQGFNSDLGYSPVNGSTQTMIVKLIPLNKKNAEEGITLARDDVARYFYPFPIPPTSYALRAKPETLTIGVRFFDDSEKVILSGQAVLSALNGLQKMCGENPGKLKVPIGINVKVRSTTPPKGDLVGKVNVNRVPNEKP